MPANAEPSAPEYRANQTGRGRNARSPGQIPARGWKDVLWRAYSEIGDDRVMLVAAGVTFYMLLALVPGLTALISIFGLFADPAVIQEQAAALQAFVPGGGMEILNDQLTRLAEQEDATLGVTFLISLGLAIWSANAGVKALFEAMNVAYDETEKRGFVKLTLISLCFTIGALTAAVLFVGTVIVLPHILKFFWLDSQTEWLIRIASYAGIFLVTLAGISALYRWGPSRAKAQWKWITPGAALTVVVVLVVSILFSWYVSNFGSYNETYGSLGAIVGFMTWIWISVMILVVGAELNAEMEHQTARDTTKPPGKPLGARGATMADSIGPAVGGPEADDPEYGEPHARQRRQRGRNLAPQDGRPAPRQMSATALGLAIPVLLLLTWLGRRR